MPRSAATSRSDIRPYPKRTQDRFAFRLSSHPQSSALGHQCRNLRFELICKMVAQLIDGDRRKLTDGIRYTTLRAQQDSCRCCPKPSTTGRLRSDYLSCAIFLTCEGRQQQETCRSIVRMSGKSTIAARCTGGRRWKGACLAGVTGAAACHLVIAVPVTTDCKLRPVSHACI